MDTASQLRGRHSPEHLLLPPFHVFVRACMFPATCRRPSTSPAANLVHPVVGLVDRVVDRVTRGAVRV